VTQVHRGVEVGFSRFPEIAGTLTQRSAILSPAPVVTSKTSKVYTHTYIHACIHTYIHEYAYKYIYIYIHTHTHTHKHTHTYIYSLVGGDEEGGAVQRDSNGTKHSHSITHKVGRAARCVYVCVCVCTFSQKSST
jgi:hypothetical protein